ncbi:MAG: apolipoprotein N-acyltransferase [Actinomycetota bacterium]
MDSEPQLTGPETVAAKTVRAGRFPWVDAAAVALSALLLTLAAPPYEQAWLGWVAVAPLFWALLRASERPRPLRSAAAVGFWHGFFYLLLLATWFAAFTPAGYPVGAVYWGLLSAAATLLTLAAIRRVPSVLTPPLLAAGWTVLEWLRAQGVFAFPWGTLAATQYRNIAVLQMLDLTGAYGLSFLMALTAASLAAWVHGARGQGRLVIPAASSIPTRSGLATAGPAWAALALLLLAVSMGRGAWLLSRSNHRRDMTKVAVVQASESRVMGPAVVCVSPLEEYEKLTKQALKQGAKLVVWPESAVEQDAVNDPVVLRRLRDLLWGTEAHLLAGSFVVHPESGMTTNASVMLAPGGRILGQYAKVLIVPFGEYLPFRPLLGWTERLGMPPQDMRAGERWTPLPWAQGKVGGTICFESAFGYVSREHVRRGANLLAVLTSDGWAGRTTAGRQHAAFAPLRAVETRRSIARAAATGISQLLDPYGRPARSLPMFTKGIAVADLPLRTDHTLYTQLGDWPVAGAWLLLLVAPFAVRRSRARQGSDA